MKKVFLQTIVICTIAILAGCSTYSNLLKSKDYLAMYQAAKEYYDQGKYTRAIQLLEIVTPYSQATQYEDSVLYFLGTSNYKLGYFDASSELFNRFRMTYTQSPFIEEVEYMYAMGFYYMSPPADRDQSYTNRALIALEEYLSRYPQSAKKEEVIGYIRELTHKIHEKAYINAYTYYKIGQYKAAIVAFRNMLTTYYDTSYKEELLYLIVKSNYLLAKDSIEELQRNRYIDTVDSYYTFVSQFPESKYKSELDKIQQSSQNFLDKNKNQTDSNNTI